MCVANSQENSVDLLMHENIYIANEIVNVADVLDVRLLDRNTVQALREIIIAKSPIPGYGKTISRNFIKKVLRNFKKGAFLKFNVVGSEKVVINRKSKLIRSEIYINKAEELLSKYLSKKYSDINLEAVGKNKNIFVPDTKIDFILMTDNLKKINSRVCAMLEIVSDGKFFSRLPVWFKLTGKYEAYVLHQNITKSSELKKQMLTKTYVDISNTVSRPLVTLDKLNAFVTNKMIRKGQILTHDHLIPKMDVMKGNSVSVIVEVGNVTLFTQAIAKQNGSVGDVVELFNKNNNEVFKGIVINENYVSSL